MSLTTYELERKISDKADKWQISDLDSQIRNLRHKNESLERTIGDLRSDLQSTQHAIRELMSYLIARDEDNYNTLETIRQQI